jgi:hypothetical protein
VLNVSSIAHAGDGQGPIVVPASDMNGESASACDEFTAPEFDGQLAPCPVTLNPPPDTLASNGTVVLAVADAYSQFSDTYNPVVPLPPDAA